MAIVFGHPKEAVAVFFVLSGFLIRYSTAAEDKNWADYSTARLSRLYPVVLVALVTTFSLDKIGEWFHPKYYASLLFYAPETVESAIRYLTFTNEIWSRHDRFGTAEPFWSLGFEAWYLFYGLCLYLPSRWRFAAVAVSLFIVGPQIVLYLPLWLMGAVAYSRYAGSRWEFRRGPSGLAIFCLANTGYLCAFAFAGPNVAAMYVPHMWQQEILSAAYYYLVGGVAYFNIVAFARMAGNRPFLLTSVARWIRWGAGASFTLYLMHQPVMVLIGSFVPATNTSLVAAVFVCLTTLAACLLLAEIGERRRNRYRDAFRAFFSAAGKSPIPQTRTPDH